MGLRAEEGLNLNPHDKKAQLNSKIKLNTPPVYIKFVVHLDCRDNLIDSH